MEDTNSENCVRDATIATRRAHFGITRTLAFVLLLSLACLGMARSGTQVRPTGLHNLSKSCKIADETQRETPAPLQLHDAEVREPHVETVSFPLPETVEPKVRTVPTNSAQGLRAPPQNL